ncbi:MAG TPA: hypothetical protein VEC19_05635 [Usitatibacter sp.]|nr:hypothetical protein [Usitatibacter sp.]
MRHLIAILALAAAPLVALAQAPKYAVLSLVGDKLLIVEREMTTGSRLDKNERTVVDLPDNSIDRAITLAIDDALRRANPGTQPILLASQRADLYAASYNAMDRADGVARVYQAVKPIVGKTGATHLVLVTKHRGRAMLRLRDGHVGTGFLEGVGFYVDHGTMSRGVDTNDAESGFIGPFAYMNISLIELSSGRIVSQQHVVGSNAQSPNPRERNVGNAWQRLSDDEKVKRLTEVIREEAARAVPMVVAAR